MKSEVKAALIRFHKCFVIQPARWLGSSQGGSEPTCSVPPAFLSHLSQPSTTSTPPSPSSVPETGAQLRLHMGLQHSVWRSRGCG